MLGIPCLEGCGLQMCNIVSRVLKPLSQFSKNFANSSPRLRLAWFPFVVLAIVSCKDIKRPGLETLLFLNPQTNSAIGVVTTDFGGGGRFKTFQTNSNVALPGEIPIHSDAVSRYYLQKVFIVNRLGRDSIFVLNPNQFFLPEIQFSVGQGTNAQDIAAISSTKAYVTRYNSRDLLVVNPSVGLQTGIIPLGQFAEPTSNGITPDGLPEMSWMVSYQSKVYVTLQRLDRNDPAGFLPPNASSLLVEIDTSSDSITGVFTFRSRNPNCKPQIKTIFGDPHAIFCLPNRLGFISRLDGAVEAFNLRTRAFYPNFLLEETNAGGDIVGAQIASETLGYANILTPSFEKKIISFNPSNGQVLNTILSIPASSGSVLTAFYLDPSGKLFVGNTDFTRPGIFIIQNQVLQNPIPINVGLAPSDFTNLE